MMILKIDSVGFMYLLMCRNSAQPGLSLPMVLAPNANTGYARVRVRYLYVSLRIHRMLSDTREFRSGILPEVQFQPERS
jgi:hypothetical protein